MSSASWALVLGALLLGVKAVAGEASIGCSTPETTYTLDGQPIELHLKAHDAGWLRLEEAGQRVSVSGGDLVITIPQPLRYGWHWVLSAAGDTIVVRRVFPGQAASQIKAIMQCGAFPEGQEKLDWLRRAGELGSNIDNPVSGVELERKLEDIRALDRDASDAWSRAVSGHYLAEVLMANGRHADSIVAFSNAESLWRSRGDSIRALAARVGRVESLGRTASHQNVLDETPAIEKMSGEQTYFSVRLESNRCAALQALGELDGAEKCFGWAMHQYRLLDEPAEYVVALQNLASLLRDRGQLNEADRLGEQGLVEADGPEAPALRGRLHLMLADVAKRRGNIPRSFGHLNSALQEFEQPIGDIERWRGNAWLYAATLNRELGAEDEALICLHEALKHLSVRDAPSRLAVAMNVFADVEEDLQHDTSALLWRHAAEETYESLHLKAPHDATKLLRLEQQVRKGDLAEARQILTEPIVPNPLDASRQLILRASLSLAVGDFVAFATAVSDLKRKPLSIRQQLRTAELESNYSLRRGDPGQAEEVLAAAFHGIRSISFHATSPLLRLALERQASSIRRLAIEHLLGPGTEAFANSRREHLLNWLEVLDHRSNYRVAAHDDAFDHTVASELLAGDTAIRASAETAAQRHLVSIFAEEGRESGVSDSTSNPMKLISLQESVGEGSAFVAYLDGNTRGALLWITRDTATVLDAAAPQDVRTASLALRFKLRSAGASVAEIDAAQQRLSDALLSNLPGSPPKRLYVLSDESTDGVAWSVLRWPGRSDSLIDTTAVSVVQLEDGNSATSMQPPASVRVIVAAQKAEREPTLPRLAGADTEARQIEAALAQNGIGIDASAAATRASVLSTLGEPGAWVHIAAHGMAQPQRIGYAGIWLEPTEQDATPPFLSWLDVLDAGARADLVVLDACRLGDSGNVIGANLSFAAAVVRAGARHVVAASWPVSDSASAMWVPAFYEALTGDPRHDPAQALRVAQLRLRQSRAFTHPFFWASLQTLESLPVDVSREPAPKIARTH